MTDTSDSARVTLTAVLLVVHNAAEAINEAWKTLPTPRPLVKPELGSQG
jgi:hypothetical protein